MSIRDTDGVPAIRDSNGSGVRSEYRAWLFGPFRVTRDDEPLGEPTWPRASARKLLKWLLLNPGESSGGTDLCDLLWPGRRSKDCTNRLHVTLHCLRQILEPDLARQQASTFIRTDRHGRYWFEPAGCWWLDVLETERLWQAARSARRNRDRAAAIVLYQQVISYYEQTFLPEDIYDDAFDPFRTSHGRRYDAVLRELLDLYLHEGLNYEVISCASALLENDPYSELAMRAIAEVNLREGNVTRASTELDRFVWTIEHDLGTAPGKDLLELRRRIRLLG
ncbi:BTAD domain-containing putative transcriptional regulator [Nocardia sp. NPDC051321]|uniref:AfsR/SARP family transcriptional regulator n=1 Tax=Nocardia sp. NPDC051321 TaxID=3364323 RepID=UPI0037B73F21